MLLTITLFVACMEANAYVPCLYIAFTFCAPYVQVLAVCKDHHVRLTGQLYAQLLKAQLHSSTSHHSPKPGSQLEDVLDSLRCLMEDADKWFLLLDANDTSALCAVLGQHEQHEMLLQTVTSQLVSPKVCLQCRDLYQVLGLTAVKCKRPTRKHCEPLQWQSSFPVLSTHVGGKFAACCFSVVDHSVSFVNAWHRSRLVFLCDLSLSHVHILMDACRQVSMVSSYMSCRL